MVRDRKEILQEILISEIQRIIKTYFENIFCNILGNVQEMDK